MRILDFLNSNSDWESILSQEPYHIDVARDGEYIILKYSQIKSDFSNELVRQCRGSIFKQVDGKFECVCMPFYKFGNHGESYADNIDWSTASVLEKLDGSLIKLWYDNGAWHWSTNNTIDARKAGIRAGKHSRFHSLVMEALNGDESFLDVIDKQSCYMFELISPFNRIIAEYKETKLALIGARNMTTMQEYSQEDLEKLYEHKLKNTKARFILPKRYKLNSLDDCLEATKSMSTNEEGFVVVDKNFNRVKIKSTAWLAAAKIKNNGVISAERVVQMMSDGVLDDFKAYCPEHTDYIDTFISRFNKLEEMLAESLVKHKENLLMDRKNFAQAIKSEPKVVQSFLFLRHDGLNIAVRKYLGSIRPKRLAEIIEDIA